MVVPLEKKWEARTMKRLLGAMLLASLVAVAAFGIASGEDKKAEAPKSVTMTGEIVDMGCYMGHNAMGEQHAACAAKCIGMGMPMGLLTDKDKKLYLITPPHDNQDAFNQCKDMAGSMVQMTGTVMEKDGVKAITVTAVTKAPATPAKKS
jgi:hypothetical protein